MTYHLNVMYTPAKFHGYIQNGLGIVAWTRKYYRQMHGRTGQPLHGGIINYYL